MNSTGNSQVRVNYIVGASAHACRKRIKCHVVRGLSVQWIVQAVLSVPYRVNDEDNDKEMGKHKLPGH
jgi:hypothetical protein